ncbi:MAG: hypothetical protein K5744_05200 [Eubacterium sp.]|nr:hypothetical protein [Eubacterium sp.]
MDKELYKELGIKKQIGLANILDELENRQFHSLEKLQSSNNEEEKRDLESLLNRIEKEIADIKDQMKSLQSGIILDNKLDLVKNSLSKAKMTIASAQKKKDISKRVEHIKQKDAEKQKKEEIENTPQSSSEANDNTNSSLDNTDNSQEFKKALVEYKNGNLTAAYIDFHKLAENGNATAQYMIANMCRYGEGVNQNDERADFWMKKSADNGYSSAQFNYGIMLIMAANGTNNLKLAEEGLSYLGMAADAGNTDALKKYIEVTKAEVGGRRAYKRAINYCDVMKTMCSDSYDCAQYDESRMVMRKLYKGTVKSEIKMSFSNVLAILGSLLCIVGIIYLLSGMYPLLWDHNVFFKILPDASDTLVISKLCEISSEIMNKNAIFGIEVSIIGWCFMEASRNIRRKKFMGVMNGAAVLSCAILVVLHVFVSIQQGREMEFLINWFSVILIIWGISATVGAVLGNIIKKLFKLNIR